VNLSDQHIPAASPQPDPTASPQPTGPTTVSPKTKRRLRVRDPLSIVLVSVIVLALAAAGLIGAELYARNRAANKVAATAGCVVDDRATASFGAMPPFLWQHINGDYTNIMIFTAGNQIKRAKGMKAVITVLDVDLHGDANSKGTIGALDAQITWTSDGIRKTIQDTIPLFGSFVNGVKSSASDGSITLQGMLGDIVVKPQVVNNKISLPVTSLSGLGFTLPGESVQPFLDAFTDTLASDLPLGIHADSIQVTDSGVVAHFSTHNTKIPQATTNPCFANL
jgi:LmeA-like phospholipid-binding